MTHQRAVVTAHSAGYAWLLLERATYVGGPAEAVAMCAVLHGVMAVHFLAPNKSGTGLG
jgi:hypothetical protein